MVSNPVENAPIPASSIEIVPKRSFLWFQTLKEQLEIIGENIYFNAVMTLLTLWALFSGDIRLAATHKEADPVFEIITISLIVIFLIEICMLSIYKSDYFCIPKWKRMTGETTFHLWRRRLQFGSFYFWLDTFAALSLLIEVDFECQRFLSLFL
jgi:hypothetical protein